MQKLFSNVFMLEGDIGGRPLQFAYLKGKIASIVLDTGCAHDPTKFIAPQIRKAGGNPKQLSWIINSHPDLDHTGGNHEMKRLAPNAILACGDPDRLSCESVEGLLKYRYEFYRKDHQIFYPKAAVDWIKAEGGKPQPIEVTFRGGEHIRLSDDWEVEILSVPGHARGHLAILDSKNKALYGGDAIHGSGCLDKKGNPALCPTYLHVDDYLNTIQLIEHLPIETYMGCHWPIKKGNEIKNFCAESRAFVTKADKLVIKLLEKPHTLREICMKLGPQLGEWDSSKYIELVYVLEGHVDRLLNRNLIVARKNRSKIFEYELV